MYLIHRTQYYIIPLLATLDRCGVVVDGPSQLDNRHTDSYDVVVVYSV